MFVALWEHEVKPSCEEGFEKVYAPEGDWAKLLQKDENYRETRLPRDASRTGVYVTWDFWTTREAYEEFKAEHDRAYTTLDAACEDLTIREDRLGCMESDN